MSHAPDDPRYAELLEREARHWGGVAADPDNPQLWDDAVLWEAALGRAWRRLIDRAVASGGPVLELGCGEGGLALELARRGVEVLGLDLSPARIARARIEATNAGLEGRNRVVGSNAGLGTTARLQGRLSRGSGGLHGGCTLPA